ncbi:MAG: hypothetical protein AWU58_491 [Methanohalophilus sp. T328-1]|jgi:hypothetical protein|nr:MAG: hypothetical protein AWU58_491 [Methanohalophilus sp. T328-1]
MKLKEELENILSWLRIFIVVVVMGAPIVMHLLRLSEKEKISVMLWFEPMS